MKKTAISKLLMCAFTFALIASITLPTYGSPAYPYPIEYIQPDGTVITIQLSGDEFTKMAHTIDGYTLMRNSAGAFEYAVLDSDNNLAPSGTLAVNESDRDVNAKSLLLKTAKGISYSSSQVSMMKSIKAMVEQDEIQHAFPTTGDRELVCILMEYQDVSFTKTQSDFDNLFNQVDYITDNASGSVKDYYTENSYGKLNLSVTVAGPYTADNNMVYYGGNGDGDARDLTSEAVIAADSDLDYSNFDNDGDGYVDGVYVIFAGYGEEAGASSDAIWSHAWSISTLILDDTKIYSYACSPELRGNSGSNITRIGVICHEFGHVLGAADFYDVNSSTGGSFTGTGQWDLMGGGTWNNSGATPAHHTAYNKVNIYNWASATVLNSSASISLNNVTEDDNSFYRFNTTTDDEYFLIENRQQTNFDASIPGSGMIIYHVHSDIANGSINNTYPQMMYPVCASSTSEPSSTSASYGSINSSGCPFPGSSGKTSFTDNTIPSSKSWDGNNTSLPITNIVENSGYVTFDFNGGAPSVNLALNGMATQSSTDYSGNADLAIDDNTSGDYDDGSVTLTLSEDNPWWQVDLGSEKSIGEIIIYNRTDECCIDRLSNFTVSIINSAGTTTFSETYTSYPNPSTIVDAMDAQGRVVKIQLNATNALSLAEVQVIEGNGIVTKLDQAISFPDIAVKTLSSSDFDPAATASSSLAVSYTSSNTSVATMVSGMIHIVGTGTSIISASQAGNTTYNEAPNVTQTLTSSINYPVIYSFSGEQDGNPASNILDGDDTDDSRWSASGFSQNVIVDYGENISIIGTRVSTYLDRAYQYIVEVSSDLSSWQMVVDRSSNTSSTQPILDNFTTVSARYVRIRVSGAFDYEGPWVSLTEFAVIEDESNLFSRIEAEDFDAMSGVRNETTYDVDGESNVGYIENGDWCMYSGINLRGASRIDFRVSSGSTSSSNIEVRLGSSTGTLIGTASVSNTGGWQTWETIDLSFTGMSGTYDVYLVYTGGSDYLFNFNWFKFSSGSTTTLSSLETQSLTEISIYPNPVKGELNIANSEGANVEIFNSTGVLMYASKLVDNEESVDMSSLPNGFYFVKITNNGLVKTQKIIKQ